MICAGLDVRSLDVSRRDLDDGGNAYCLPRHVVVCALADTNKRPWRVVVYVRGVMVSAASRAPAPLREHSLRRVLWDFKVRSSQVQFPPRRPPMGALGSSPMRSLRLVLWDYLQIFPVALG